jgi:predicted TIM-barrel fold metal-dependent hydrolase
LDLRDAAGAVALTGIGFRLTRPGLMYTCPGPDPNPHKPRFVLPAKATDVHCHVFGPAGKFPYATGKYRPPDAPKETLAALYRFLGIERSVIVHPSCHGTDNSVTLDAIASSQGRYRGIALIDDSFSERDLRALHEGGMRGARFHFVPHLGGMPDLAMIDRVIPRIAALGWHLVLHFDAKDLPDIAGFLHRLPLPFIIDHMGRINAGDGIGQKPFQDLLEIAKLENCWVKVSGADRISSAGPPFHDAIPYASALIAAAPERVLWGTDFPHPNIAKFMPNDGDLVDLLPLMAPDPAAQQKLLVDNPARLYGFTD